MPKTNIPPPIPTSPTSITMDTMKATSPTASSPKLKNRLSLMLHNATHSNKANKENQLRAIRTKKTLDRQPNSIPVCRL